MPGVHKVPAVVIVKVIATTSKSAHTEDIAQSTPSEREQESTKQLQLVIAIHPAKVGGRPEDHMIILSDGTTMTWAEWHSIYGN